MWIPSKLTLPGRLHNAIVRPRVLEILEQAPYYKLVLFRSPAGYGKTTMAAQWLHDKPNMGWFSIDESDNDSYRFMNYFIETINKATNGSCETAKSVAEKRQYTSVESLVADIFAELSQFHEQSYIVLDDYHLIDNPTIHSAMRYFLKHIPNNITLVVTSRANPPLGTANLRVRDLMIEIGNELLAFDNEETTRFFNLRFKDDVDPELADKLRLNVEGWPSALQLIAIQAQQQQKSLSQAVDSVSNFGHAHLWEYLVEEVFDVLDEDTQLFLMQCSILDRFNDQLVAEVTQRDDALAMLEKLNKFGLFVYSLDNEKNWFRFHNLFSDFLAHERSARIPQQLQSLNHKAALAWLKHGSPSLALQYANKAQSQTLCTEIIIQKGWEMFNHGELKTMESTIAALPHELLYSNPKIPLLRAWLAQSQHNYNEVGSLLDEAEKELSERDISLSTAERGQLNSLRAQVAINQDEPERALEIAETSLEQIDSNDFRSRIVSTSVIGEVNHVTGRLSRALPVMQQTEKFARQYRVYHHALWAILQQSEILIAQGYVQAAFDLQEHAFKLIDEHHLQYVPLHEFLLRLRAQIFWCWNRLSEAEECAYKGIQVLGQHSSSQHLHSYSMLARIAVGRGELDKAGRIVEQIQQLLQESHYHVDWSANAALSQILYWQAKGDLDSIFKWLQTAQKPESACNHFTQLQWRNIARGQICVGEFDSAKKTLEFLHQQTELHNLVTDTNRNLIVDAVYNQKVGNQEQAFESLKEALSMTNQTGIIGNFLVDGQVIEPLLIEMQSSDKIGELEKYRAESLLKEISSKHRKRAVHFDENFVEKLVNHPNIPELVRTSPLTQREWQVLGLIYSGFSNEQIAQELDVAGTTIKTHIRNLYQKLNLANRKEAIATAENLLNLMGL